MWLVLVNSLGAASWLPKSLRAGLYRRCGVLVGEHTHIFPGQVFRPGRIRIGRRCFINTQCLVDPGTAEVRIEDDVFLSSRVSLLADTHEIGPSTQRAGRNTASAVSVGRGAWLGAGVTVLSGVRIGAGCVIGAGAVVTANTVPNGLYVGVPARLVRVMGDGPGPHAPS